MRSVGVLVGGVGEKWTCEVCSFHNTGCELLNECGLCKAKRGTVGESPTVIFWINIISYHIDNL